MTMATERPVPAGLHSEPGVRSGRAMTSGAVTSGAVSSAVAGSATHRTRRAARIAVVTDNATSPALRRAAVFAAAELTVAGLSVSTVPSGADYDGWDGMVVAGGARPAGSCPPAVLLDDQGASTTHLTVSASLEEVGRLAALHLLGYGRRNLLAVCGGDPDPGELQVVVGYETAVTGDGAAFRQCHEADLDQVSLDQIDGIFVTSESAAVSTFAALARRRVAVPTAVAVVGFGDYAFEAARMPVPLTTVGLASRRMGSAASRMLLAALDHKPMRTTSRTIGPELTVRRSAPHAPRLPGGSAGAPRLSPATRYR